MKKIIVVMTLIFTSIVMAENEQHSPSEVLIKYLDATMNDRPEESYLYLSKQDKSVKSLDVHVKEIQKVANNPFSEILINGASYEVLSVEEAVDTANVKLAITLPDIKVLMRESMGMALSIGLANATPETVSIMITKKYKDEKPPTMTENSEFQLVKEKDGWKVFLDLKTKKEKAEKEKYEIKAKAEKAVNIDALLESAKQLRKSKKLNEAIEKYEEVLALDGELIEAQNAMKATQDEIKSINEKKDYLKNVKLYGLIAKYSRGKENPVVKFKIQNKGDRALYQVEVIVYFQDKDGNTIAEKVFRPVDTYNSHKSLKPKYIWNMGKSLYLSASSVPSEWKEGAVTAKITNIEFERKNF